MKISRITTKYFKDYNIKNIINKSGNYDGNNSERYIIHIETENNEYALKIYTENLITDISILKAYYQYGKLLNDFGVLTPNLILNKDSNTHKITRIEDKSYISWLEEYIPSKYTYPNLFPSYNMPVDIFYEMGKINGKMNRLSSEHKIPCTKNLSKINFKNVILDYNFKSIQNTLKQIKNEKSELILKIYTEKRQALKNIFNTLKRGYVQGDCSPANLIISSDDKILGFYDYNLSGNEIYIINAINNGIFYAFEYCVQDKKFTKEYLPIMKSRFNEYMNGYFSEFNCSDDIKAVDLLCNILRPTRFQMTYIKDLLDNKEYDMLDYMLDWVIEEIQCSNVLNH